MTSAASPCCLPLPELIAHACSMMLLFYCDPDFSQFMLFPSDCSLMFSIVILLRPQECFEKQSHYVLSSRYHFGGSRER